MPLPQRERNQPLQSTVEKCVPNNPSLGCNLGDCFFILVGDEQFHSEIMSLRRGFEELITEYLSREMGAKDQVA